MTSLGTAGISRVLKIAAMVIVIALILLSAFFLIGIGFVGDRACSIKIKNERKGNLVLKTYKINQFEKSLFVDSVNLLHGETMQIGRCIGCRVPDTLNLEFDAIGIYIDSATYKIMNRQQLIDYLETGKKEDCIVYRID
jgi:hypothetical protein